METVNNMEKKVCEDCGKAYKALVFYGGRYFCQECYEQLAFWEGEHALYEGDNALPLPSLDELRNARETLNDRADAARLQGCE